MSQLQQQHVQTVYNLTASGANNQKNGKIKKKHFTTNTKVTK